MQYVCREIFCGNLIILPDTQDGTVPHRDKPAHIPWSVGEHKQTSHAKEKIGGAGHPPLWEMPSLGVAHQGLLELHRVE